MNARAFHGVILGLMIPSVVPAQQILSYVATVPLSPADWTAALQLPKFDPKAGTLTSVTLFYSADIAQSVFGENKSGSSATYDFSTTEMLYLTRPGGPNLIPSSHAVLHQGGTLAAFDGQVDYAGLSGVTFSQTTPFHSQLNDSNLAAYVGTGEINFDATALICSDLSVAGCAGVVGASGLAAADLTVQYTFCPIPEPPASAALLGLLVLGFAVRRFVTTA